MRNALYVLSVFLALIIGQNALAKKTQPISPTQAIHAVGQKATVCGKAASVHFAARSRGQPTFINLGAPYPHEVFTILIWGDERPAFKPAPETWQGKTICVNGLVKLYRGTPEIIAHSPSQIRGPKSPSP